MSRIRRYSEMSRLNSFDERLNYLKLEGHVGHSTFGFDRYINQTFYRSREWRQARDYVVVRDNGCDLGIRGYEIHGELLVHHVNPMDVNDIVQHEEWVLDPEYLITTTQKTHNVIHYGIERNIPKIALTRAPGDTKLW